MHAPAIRLVCSLLVAAVIPAAARAQGGPAAVTSSTTATTRLYVRTIPAGAQVTIDGSPLGTSDGLFLVPAGTAKVTVQFDGRDPEVRQVEIAEGHITRLEITPGAGGAPAAPADSRVFAGPGITPPAPKVPGLRSRRTLAQPLAALTPIDALLDKPVEKAMDFQETPLDAVARRIGEAAGVDVAFDRRALEAAGLDLEATTVTARWAGLPLASLLDTVCRDFGITWTVRDRDVVVTTLETAQEQLLVHVHDVSDLITDDCQILIDVIQGSVAAHTWDTVGGPGAIRPDGTKDGAFLVVIHTLDVHRQVAGFLARLRTLKATPAGTRGPLAAEGYWNDSPQTVAIRQALDRVVPGPIEFAETPLRAALAEIEKVGGVAIAVDSGSLTAAGIDLDATTLSGRFRELPLARLLERLLDEVGLVASVERDQLVVTTKESAHQHLSVAIYPIDRLLVAGRDGQAIVDLLQTTVSPEQWDVVGGPAVARFLDGDAPCLVVEHTTAGHRAVAAFLGSLR